MIIISDSFRQSMRDLLLVLLFVAAVLMSAASSAQPLSFLGDVSKMSPLDCLDRQCAAVGGNCAEKCVGTPDQIVCMAHCSQLLNDCYKTRCFITIRKVTAAQAYCCDSGKFGCLYDDNAGCLDNQRRDCGVNKGFNESYLSCINANLTKEQGNASLNFTYSAGEIDGSGSCRDSSQCDSGRVCFKGLCVLLSDITTSHRAEVDCLDDADCPSSTTGKYVCLDSACVMRPPNFCRVQSDCKPDWSCSDLACLPPPPSQVIDAPVPVEPASAVLQQWAKSRAGIMARVTGIAGSPKSGAQPAELSIGRFFSQGDDIIVPGGMAVELVLADGSRAMLGPGVSMFLRSISAKGSSLSIEIGLRKGAVLFDVAPLQEVERRFDVSSFNRSVMLAPGTVHMVAYKEGALRVANVDGNATFDGMYVEPGYFVLMDVSGVKRPAAKLSQQELKLLDQASQSPTVSTPPAYVSESMIDKYGLLALAILAVFILSMWMFFKRRPRSGHPHDGIKWQKFKYEFEQEPPKL